LAKKMPRGSVWIFTIVALVLVALLSIGGLISFLVDYQWFNEVGYTGVFFARLINGFKIGIPLFAIIFILLYIYLKGMQKDFYRHSSTIPSNDERKSINRIFIIASLVVSFFISLSMASSLWLDILRYTNAAHFGISDPIFNIDIGFYMFRLPLLR
jgi:uncharacterized membrane protein (UPF0182 family)